MRTSRIGKWFVALSLLVALFLTIIPLPSWAIWFRPLWVLMVLIYWALALEDKVSVGIAWLMGILVDTLQGTIFAEHALVMCCCIFIVIKLRRKLRLFPVWQQASVVLMISFFYQLLIYIIQAMIGQPIKTIWFWLPVLTSSLLWPWVFILMRDFRRHFRIT